MAKKTLKRVPAEDAAELSRLAAKISEGEGKIRSCDSNLKYFADFCADTDARLEDGALPAAERKTLEARKAYCAGEQTKNEEREKSAAERILARAREAFGKIKAKYGETLRQEGDDWVYEA